MDKQAGKETQSGAYRPAERSTGSLLSDLTRQIATLFRQEVSLARHEMAEKASKAAKNSAYIGAGAAVAYMGVGLLLLAATAGLFLGIWAVAGWMVSLWLSPLIVGAVVAIIGWAMIAKGKRTLKQEGFVPHETVDSLKENKRWPRTQAG